MDEEEPRPEYKPKAGRRRVENDGDELGAQPATRKGWGDDTVAPPPPPPPPPAELRDDDEDVVDAAEPSSTRAPKAVEESAIPDLENEGDEDLTKEVAAAPRHYDAMRVPLLAELEREGHLPLPVSWDADIDISTLTQFLSPNVEEEDVEWDPAQVFSQLTSELQLERDTQAGEDRPPT
eukprot:TRINITY_DN16800_c0_g1_i1.p1 TRINITY_DN16800_c0_g1~~TRINITY_DN16800_c0_g1_i1.p1  ORF type:complete len:204 (-),score=47.13 TRINITY_DN16800_c0_g1_i1:229-765(-)